MPITISQHGAIAEIKHYLTDKTKKEICEAFDDLVRDDDGYRAYHIIAMWHETNKDNWHNLLDLWLKRGINYETKTKTSPVREV